MEVWWWTTLAPLAGAILVGLYKGSLKFARWTGKKLLEEWNSHLREQWKTDMEAAHERLQRRWRADIDEALTPVLDELSYNGGQSVKDIVHRIERTVEELHQR